MASIKLVRTNYNTNNNHNSHNNHNNHTDNDRNQIRLTTESLLTYIKKNIQIIQNPPTVEATYDNNDADEKNDKEYDETNFSPQENGNMSSMKKLPANLHTLFSDFYSDINRIGVLKKLNQKSQDNVSLYVSVLVCCKDDFVVMPQKNQEAYVKSLMDKMTVSLKGEHFTDMGYKAMGWDKNSLYEDIQKCSSSKTLLRFLADYFHVNIFLLDVENDSLYVTGGNGYVSFKKNILLLRTSENSYEPLFYDNAKYIDYDSPIIKHLLKNNEYVEVLDVNMKSSDLSIPFVESVELLDKYLIDKCKNKLDRIVERLPLPFKAVRVFKNDDDDDKPNEENIVPQPLETNKNVVENQVEEDECCDSEVSDFEENEVEEKMQATDSVNVFCKKTQESPKSNVNQAMEKLMKEKITNKMKLTELQEFATSVGLSISNESNKKLNKEQLLTAINNAVTEYKNSQK
jgi:hypothetical protein